MKNSRFIVHLVGEPAVSAGDRLYQLKFRYRKSLGLLAVIALNNGKPLSRDFLSSLFWPEMDAAEGRLNLRQLVSDLKRTFTSCCGHFPIKALRSHLSLDRDHTCLDCDLALPDSSPLDNASAFLDIDAFSDLKQLVTSPVLNYELLSSYTLPDCDEFEEWLIVERERFHVRQLAILQSIAETLLAQGDTLNALTAAQQALKHSPHNETFLINVVNLLERRGRREAALKTCESFIKQLEREVGVPPSSELSALHQKLLSAPSSEANMATTADNTEPAAYERTLIVVLRINWHAGQIDHESFAYRLHQADVVTRQLLVQRFQAHRVRSAGRGCFYYFGWPRADQDAAFKALTATCRLQQQLKQEGLGDIASYGLHTGQVISDSIDHIPDLVGELSENAVHLARLAEPGQIVLSSPIQNVLSDRTRTRPLEHPGPLPAGIEGDIYLLERLDTTNDLFFDLNSQVQIFRQLDQLMQQIRENPATRVFTLTADAGRGKTATISEWLQRSGVAGLKLSCFPDSHHDPLQPLLDLGQALHGSDSEQQASFLKPLKQLLAVPEEERVRDDLYQKLGRLLQQAFCDLSATHPMVVWLEDAHWCDLTTLDLLTYLSRSEHFVALIICTGRREFSYPPFAAVRHDLEPLQEEDAISLLRGFQCRATTWLSPREEQRLAQLAGGNAYLLKQLLRQALKLNAPTQEAVISPFVAFIDSLGEARQVAVMAAVIGQNVELDLLHAICQQYHDNLDEQLPKLIEGGVLVKRSQQLLTFEHALLRNALLELTPQSEFQEYNRFLADHLSRLQQLGERFSANRIAQYYSHAGESRKARQIWLTSGLEAMKKGVFDSAAHQLESALKSGIRDDLPPPDLLELLLTYAQARSFCFGYGDAKAFKVSLEAAELARSLDGPDNQFQFLAFFNAFLCAGATDEGPLIKYARMLNQLATNDSQQLVASWAMSHALFWGGNLEESRKWCYRGKEMIGDIPPDEYFRFGYQDLRLASTIFTGWNEALLGNREAALAEAESLLGLIPKSDPYNYCHTLLFAAVTFYWCGLKERSAELARECRDIAHRGGFDLWFYAGSLLEMATGEFCKCEVDETRIMQMLEGIRQTYNGYALAVLLGLDALEFRLERHAQKRLINHCLEHLSDEALGFALPELLRLRAVLNAEDGCARETVALELERAETLAKQMKARWHLKRIRQTRQALEV